MSIEQQIAEVVDLRDIAMNELSDAKEKGHNITSKCPSCAGKKFSVNLKKKVYKCWSGCSLAGYGPIYLVTITRGITYPEAVKALASEYGVETDYTVDNATLDGSQPNDFREKQLAGSGLTREFTRYNGEDRYLAATIDQGWNIIRGDDMVLRYLDLDGQPMKYTAKSRARDMIRVRWALPDLHRNAKGDPMKYQSPFGSRSCLWLTNAVIDAYQQSAEFDTLYVTEGEKKADKMTLHNMHAVGISGIHNFNNDLMPDHFREIIKRCKVKRLVFLLDADFMQLSKKDLEKLNDAGSRPKSFASAAIKFRNYISGLQQADFDVRLFLQAGKGLSTKGIDDLLATTPNGNPLDSLLADMQEAFTTGYESEHLYSWEITGLNDFKLRKIFNIHDKESFFEAYKEDLKGFEKFRYNGILYKMDANGIPEIAQPVLPEEQYWHAQNEIVRGELITKYYYKYAEGIHFLKNRGYGQMEYNSTRQIVHLDNNVVKKIDGVDVRRYIREYSREIGEKEVYEMMIRGGNSYLGSERLEALHYFNPDFLKPDPTSEYLYFDEYAWKITADKIEQVSYSELPGYIWNSDRIDRNSQLEQEPLFEIVRGEDKRLHIGQGKNFDDCDYARFLWNTCKFFHAEPPRLDKHGLPESPRDLEKYLIMESHMISKILTIGYILHSYIQESLLKAVVCMDYRESPVGQADGGTGKSIFGKTFKYLCNFVSIDGMKPKFAEDPYIFSEIDHNTRGILIDDCRPNMDFSYWFSKITNGIEVRKMRENPYGVGPKKIIFTTNHAIRGAGNSFERRQYLLGFSDYYGKNRTPRDEFGYDLFLEWNGRQFELFDNFAASAVKAYLKFGLGHEANAENLEIRKKRQEIGEDFLEWAESYFTPTSEQGALNCKVERSYAYRHFTDIYPNQKRYVNMRDFKRKLKTYCDYKGLDFNPGAGSDGRIKSGILEYYIVADKNYKAHDVDIFE